MQMMAEIRFQIFHNATVEVVLNKKWLIPADGTSVDGRGNGISSTKDNSLHSYLCPAWWTCLTPLYFFILSTNTRHGWYY